MDRFLRILNFKKKKRRAIGRQPDTYMHRTQPRRADGGGRRTRRHARGRGRYCCPPPVPSLLATPPSSCSGRGTPPVATPPRRPAVPRTRGPAPAPQRTSGRLSTAIAARRAWARPDGLLRLLLCGGLAARVHAAGYSMTTGDDDAADRSSKIRYPEQMSEIMLAGDGNAGRLESALRYQPVPRRSTHHQARAAASCRVRWEAVLADRQHAHRSARAGPDGAVPPTRQADAAVLRVPGAGRGRQLRLLGPKQGPGFEADGGGSGLQRGVYR